MSKNPHKNKLKSVVAVGLVVTFATLAAIIAIATFQGDKNQTAVVEPRSTEPEAVIKTPPVAQTAEEKTAVTETPLACGVKGGSCTKAEVAVHNQKTDCWVIYKNDYYNVTSYVSSHPGGEKMFNADTCGKDIEAFLNGSASSAGETNKHSSSAYSMLASFKVGPVK